MINNEIKSLEKTILLTGSTGKLGVELVKMFSQQKNLNVILIGRTSEKILENKKQLEEKNISCRIEYCDFRNIDELQKLCNKMSSQNIIPDTIINCAGVGLKELSYKADTISQIDMLKINIEALTLLTIHFLPNMINRGHGEIINISSVAALQPSPGVAVYAATKAYVNSFSIAVDYECSGTGVRVFTIAPGPFIDKFEFDEFVKRPGLFRKQRTLTTEQIAKIIDNCRNNKNSLIIPGIWNRIFAFCAKHFGLNFIMSIVPLISKGQKIRIDNKNAQKII